MKIPSSLPRLKSIRYLRVIGAYVARAYHRFVLSTVDVKDLPAEHRVIASREAIHPWVNLFGTCFAAYVRRDWLCPNSNWSLNEVVILIKAVKHWLWSAVDANGDRCGFLVQTSAIPKLHSAFLPHTTRSKPALNPADTTVSPSLIAMPAQMQSVYGSTMPAGWRYM